jgi:hypothetical protein
MLREYFGRDSDSINCLQGGSIARSCAAVSGCGVNAVSGAEVAWEFSRRLVVQKRKQIAARRQVEFRPFRIMAVPREQCGIAGPGQELL